MSIRLLCRRAIPRPMFLFLLLGAVALLAACSGNDSNNGASGAGSNAASSRATPTSTERSASISAATPVPTATATPEPQASSAAAPAPTATPAPATGALTDLAPCAAQTFYTRIVSSAGVPTLAYKGVPGGTSILFPFESGSVKLVDASANGIAVTYDVPGVGLLIVGAADEEGLDRGYGSVSRGQVIGHFGGVYPDEVNQPLSGFQAYAQVLAQDPNNTNSNQATGKALEPQVTGCIAP